MSPALLSFNPLFHHHNSQGRGSRDPHLPSASEASFHVLMTSALTLLPWESLESPHVVQGPHGPVCPSGHSPVALCGPHLRVRWNPELSLCVDSGLWTHFCPLPIPLGIREGPLPHPDARPGLPPRVSGVGTLLVALTVVSEPVLQMKIPQGWGGGGGLGRSHGSQGSQGSLLAPQEREFGWCRGPAAAPGMRRAGRRPAARPAVSCGQEGHGQQGGGPQQVPVGCMSQPPQRVGDMEQELGPGGPEPFGQHRRSRHMHSGAVPCPPAAP